MKNCSLSKCFLKEEIVQLDLIERKIPLPDYFLLLARYPMKSEACFFLPSNLSQLTQSWLKMNFR